MSKTPARTSSRPPKTANQAKSTKKVCTDPFTSKQVSTFYFKAGAYYGLRVSLWGPAPHGAQH
ncbi:Hypothetical protein PHPALM_17101 [Phytophthora palmivora]|uniref:Uncharacterized protein n=1 Tax=Phytophthora palmivora TaxID=4796 RepID=A0A2P4XN42_9STRA|nr:Hypothetical protein PHPALM_17101 [Phytophthora palmivora]